MQVLSRPLAKTVPKTPLFYISPLPEIAVIPRIRSRRSSSQIAIDDILQHFLAAAALFRLAVLVDVGL